MIYILATQKDGATNLGCIILVKTLLRNFGRKFAWTHSGDRGLGVILHEIAEWLQPICTAMIFFLGGGLNHEVAQSRFEKTTPNATIFLQRDEAPPQDGVICPGYVRDFGVLLIMSEESEEGTSTRPLTRRNVSGLDPTTRLACPAPRT